MNSPDEIVAGLAADEARSERYVRANFADKVRRTLGKLGFVREAVAAYFCARDPATPGRVRVAALAGTVIPVVLNRAGVDPALASGTFVTTVTDVVGFFAFLGLAGMLLL